MFYRFASMAMACLALTACSGSEEAKKVTESTDTPVTTIATEPAEPLDIQATAKSEAQPALSVAVNTPPLDPAACPYPLAELNQTLGLNFSIVNAVDVPFAGGTQLSCQYTGEQTITLTMNKLTMQDPNLLEGMEQFLAGSLKPIPNDPDQAQWQTSDSGLNDLTLHYVRTGTSVDIRLVGVDQKDWSRMKQKLVSLRRIP